MDALHREQAPAAGSKVRVFLTDASMDQTPVDAIEYNQRFEFDSGEVNLLPHALRSLLKSSLLPCTGVPVYQCFFCVPFVHVVFLPR